MRADDSASAMGERQMETGGGDWLLPVVVMIVAIAGVMRGITGFGGAMLMSPPLGLLLGPVTAVAISLVLEAVAGLVMIRAVVVDLRPRLFAQLIVPACLTIPIGTSLLVGLDPLLARKLIAAMVLVSSLAMAAGLRYRREAGPALTVGIGGLAGVLLGATGIGGPPVVLFLLSGPVEARHARAILVLFVTITSMIGLAALAWNGVLGRGLVSWILITTPIYLVGVVVGVRVFARLTDHRARTVSLGLMMLLGALGLAL
jgi:uncharacterized membrane protein YfcA